MYEIEGVSKEEEDQFLGLFTPKLSSLIVSQMRQAVELPHEYCCMSSIIISRILASWNYIKGVEIKED